jgi:hypothetical protein
MSPDRRAVKARIIGWSLADLAIDVIVPTIATLALTAAGMAAYLALTAGGVLVGAKAALGRVADWRPDRRAARVGSTAAVGLVALFGLAAVGAPDVVAATVAGVIIAVPVIVTVVGPGRIDGIGLLVLAELVAGVVLTLVSDDPRFVLARPAIYTMVAGVYVLATCRWGRPLMLDWTKPMAAAGDPARATAFESAWAHSARFRAIERACTAALGIVLIAEAILRVAVVYSSTNPNVAVTGLLAQIPATTLILLWFLAVRFLAVPRARTLVDIFMPRTPDSEVKGTVAEQGGPRDQA